MKKILIPISTILLSGFVQAQLTSTENYIQSRTYLEPVTSSSSTAKQIETVQYFDGLGRPKQIVNVKASPLGKDIVTPILYDGFGRQIMDYLPVPQQGTNNGAIYPQQASGNFPVGDPTGVYTGEKPFSEKILENSPLDRVLQQKQVGMAWDTKPVQFGYDANTTADGVKKYTTFTTWVNGATSSVLSQSTNYAAAQLYKNTVTDEDGNVTIEFKNGEGQVLLVRKMINDTEKADTYYVYNEYNQLAFVISPKAAVETDANTVLGDLCYQYKYDGRGRMVEKKLPGKGWEYIVYDKADRVFMTQDANMRPSGNWLLTRYDKLSRVVYTAIAGIGSTYIRKDVQDAVDFHSVTASSLTEERTSAVGFTKSGLDIYYGNNTFPTNAILEVLSVNYYDSYLPGDPFPTMVYDQVVLPSNVQQYGVSTKGLPVSSFVKNIEDDHWTKKYMYYDLKGRLIREYAQNHLGGYTNIEKRLDFSGVPNIILTQHKRLATDTERVITETFEYDGQNRLLVHRHKVDNNPVEILAQNTYNELSQLQSKKVGGTVLGNGLQTVDYQYNIRGWMTQINDPDNLGSDFFGYAMKYNNPENSGLAPGRFNGNIAEIDWKTSTVANDNKRRYSFTYDKLNRLKQGMYSEPGSSVINNNNYNEQLTYDLNGNILTLKRFSKPYSGTTPELIDDLVYNYTGNRLDKITLPSGVSNNASGYNALQNTITYDSNGSMISQLDKNITTIEYNHLNLPKLFTTGSGRSKQTITYTYRADGVKVGKGISGRFSLSTNTDYLDGFQYNASLIAAGDDSSNFLQFVPTSEGYFDFQQNKYIYNYTDHLGNVRLSYFNNGSSVEVLEENNYYPFGMKHEGYNGLAGNSSYQYKYNGKELQTESGMYDYGARFYMPDIGRWGVVDPLAEQYRRFSPYNYTVNNPINFTDPDGRWVRGAGFFNNLFKSDARIHAEQWADKLGSGYYNVAVNKGNNGTWNVTSHTLRASVTETFNSGGLTNTLYIPYSEGGGLGTAPSSGNPWGPSFGSVPESRGKTDIQMLVSENPAVQGAAIDLFTGGAGSALSSLRTAIRIRRLSSQVERTAADIYAAGGAPSAVAGAELNGQTVIGISGQHPSDIAPQLQDVVEMLGGAGTKNINKTPVACCAEFQAGNELLLKNPQAFPSQINFTEAIRPRTGKVVPMCGNCKATFGK
ncbi:DUF6443 domain-containing protein [uncultured Chryseobacterium sp.]|uniref:DUF6443 domain-containing protein n=1 Tax=uncultured Chryseobacterium sp. TaxID=259322 RepID=UPI0025D9256A|nr:DUF6443 domain-containing protein [uncultured Chryseobacterium sp.]